MVQENSFENMSTRAINLADRCERVARQIAKHAESIERKYTYFRAVNVVVGAIAAVVVLSPQLQISLGSNVVFCIGLVAAVVLLIDGVVPHFLKHPSPDRLRDYAFYIHSYSGSLKNTLADAGLKDAQRQSKIAAIMELAETNLSDVCCKFSFVYEDQQNAANKAQQR